MLTALEFDSNYFDFLSLEVFFQKDLKQQTLHQFSKTAPNLIAQIIYQFRYYSIEKIVERLTHKRVMQFLNELNILYQKQFGFQKIFLTTADAIIKLIEDIEKSVDIKQYVCAVLLLTCKRPLILLITT